MELDNLVVSEAGLKVIDQGAWVRPTEANDLEFYVIGMSSEAYKAAQKEKMAKLRADNEGKHVTHEQLQAMSLELISEVCLKDWRNLTSKGEQVKFDKAIAKKIITGRGGELFTEEVMKAISKVDRDANVIAESVLKN